MFIVLPEDPVLGYSPFSLTPAYGGHLMSSAGHPHQCPPTHSHIFKKGSGSYQDKVVVVVHIFNSSCKEADVGGSLWLKGYIDSSIKWCHSCLEASGTRMIRKDGNSDRSVSVLKGSVEETSCMDKRTHGST